MGTLMFSSFPSSIKRGPSGGRAERQRVKQLTFRREGGQEHSALLGRVRELFVVIVTEQSAQVCIFPSNFQAS